MPQDLPSIRKMVVEKAEAVRQVMAAQNLSDRIEVWHEFVVYPPANQNVIKEALKAIARLPPSDPGYCQPALTIASGASSIGELDVAEEMLANVRNKSRNPPERSLAAYNLFQIRLRTGKFDEALDVLQAAVRDDAASYALHDTAAYPPLRILGAGGMGCAFQCQNKGGGKPVVVKTLWSPFQGLGDQAFADTENLRQAQTTSILAPLEHGFANAATQGKPFFVFERLPGAVDAEAWIAKNGPLSPKEHREVGTKLLETLAAAHAVGVCHLDLKPSNLLLKRVGAAIDVKITDFGLARAAGSLKQYIVANPGATGNTDFGRRIAETLSYTPPELKGQTRYGAPSFRSDIYAFGATMYKLITGDSPSKISEEKLQDQPGLHQLITACMAENPASRPNSAAEIIPGWQDPHGRVVALIAAERAARDAEFERVTSVAAEAAAEIEAKKKSKGLIFGIIGGVAAIGIAVGLYVTFGGKKEDKKDGPGKTQQTAKKGAIPEKEYDAIEKWYGEARGVVYNYLAAKCDAPHARGFKYFAKLVPQLTKYRAKNGKMKTHKDLIIKLELDSSGSPAGKLDLFGCPGKLAEVHHDHDYMLSLRVRFHRRDMFSRGSRFGTLEVSGKRIGYLDKTKFTSGVAYKGGLSLPSVRRVEDPGLRELARGRRATITEKGRELHWANIVFKREGKGSAIEGRWKATVRTNQLKKEFDDWSTGCKAAVVEGLSRLEKPRAGYNLHRKVYQEAVEWAPSLCKALEKLSRSVEPWDGSAVGAAVADIMSARGRWNQKVHKPLDDVAKTFGKQAFGKPGF